MQFERISTCRAACKWSLCYNLTKYKKQLAVCGCMSEFEILGIVSMMARYSHPSQ